MWEPERLTRVPAINGPIAAASHSVPCRSVVAESRSRSPTRFGAPAKTAGRKNESAIPDTAASTIIVPGWWANGSSAKTTSRTTSEPTINVFRESRSMSGPMKRPTKIRGMNVTRNRRATHHVDCVRASMSAVNAIVVAYVPIADPSVAVNSRRNMPFPKTAARLRMRADSVTQSPAPAAARPAPSLLVSLPQAYGSCERASERARELVDLVGSPDRYTDRGRRPEPGEWTHDHAFVEEALEQLD